MFSVNFSQEKEKKTTNKWPILIMTPDDMMTSVRDCEAARFHLLLLYEWTISIRLRQLWTAELHVAADPKSRVF